MLEGEGRGRKPRLGSGCVEGQETRLEKGKGSGNPFFVNLLYLSFLSLLFISLYLYLSLSIPDLLFI